VGIEARFSIFEENSGGYLTRAIGNLDRFPRAAVDDPKSDRLLGSFDVLMIVGGKGL
jgi:hypothetical protein